MVGGVYVFQMAGVSVQDIQLVFRQDRALLSDAVSPAEIRLSLTVACVETLPHVDNQLVQSVALSYTSYLTSAQYIADLCATARDIIITHKKKISKNNIGEHVKSVLYYVMIFFNQSVTEFCFCFYRAMHFSAKRGIAIACRLSVCLSVCNVGEL